MRRVVVTGLGLVTPLGGDVETTWANILAAKSGAGTITRALEAGQAGVEHEGVGRGHGGFVRWGSKTPDGASTGRTQANQAGSARRNQARPARAASTAPARL